MLGTQKKWFWLAKDHRNRTKPILLVQTLANQGSDSLRELLPTTADNHLDIRRTPCFSHIRKMGS